MTISIQRLIDDSKCYEMVRELRWPDGVKCAHCASENVVKNGHDTSERWRQRYRCSACQRSFDDLTGSVFAGHHQPLRVWMLCSYLMGLNLSNLQLADELSLSAPQAQEMTTELRQGISERQRKPALRTVCSTAFRRNGWRFRLKPVQRTVCSTAFRRNLHWAARGFRLKPELHTRLNRAPSSFYFLNHQVAVSV